jgi:hypothetical protein
MVESDINTPTNIVEPFKGREYYVKEKNPLISLDTQNLARVESNLSST